MGNRKPYPREAGERAVGMVLEHGPRAQSQWAAITSIAEKFGMTPETLRLWVRQDEVTRAGGRGPRPRKPSGSRNWSVRTRELRRANEIPQGSVGFLCAGARPASTQELMTFIDEHRDAFGVEPICRVLQIAPSTYWAAKRRECEPARRTVADAQLLAEIRRVYDQSRGLYGASKVWWQLRRDGITAPRFAVERLMRCHGLQGVVRGRRRRTTT